jgi:hypothetical protein
MGGQHDRASGPLPQDPTGSTLTARGAAIQNASFLLLVALTTTAFLALIGSFLMLVFWAAVLRCPAPILQPPDGAFAARMPVSRLQRFPDPWVI